MRSGLTPSTFIQIRRPAPLRGQVAFITSVGSAFPDKSYSQDEIGALLGLENRIVKKLLRSPHIQKRHLYLPGKDARAGRLIPESAADLHAKFRDGALKIGSRAIRNALDAASLYFGRCRLPAVRHLERLHGSGAQFALLARTRV